MQLKEQLAVQAVVVGIEEFECDVVFCGMDELEEGLRRVKLSESRARKVAQAAGVLSAIGDVRATVNAVSNRQTAGAHATLGTVNAGNESAAKRLRPAASVSMTGRTPADESAGAAMPLAVVDVLVVSSIVKLQDYCDTALAGSRASPREQFLQVRLST